MRRLLIALAVAAGSLAAPSHARAEGFQLERYEPTPAGTPFVAVASPWYSSTRRWAAGLTLDYGHNVLLGGFFRPGFARTVSIVEHQLVGHLDVAVSFLDRVQLSGTLPVVLLERGTPAFGTAPIGRAAVGDPRFGVLVRLWHQPERDKVSLHAGGDIWIPVGNSALHAGDATAHGRLHLVASGFIGRHLRWSGDGGVLIRAQQTLGFGPANSAASELQLAVAAGWTDLGRRVHVGPELVFASALVGPQAFRRYGTSLELLLGAQYVIRQLVQVGAALGTGLVTELGTPDVRAIVRLAYAPTRAPRPRVIDRDGDGVADDFDACPDAAGPTSANPRASGCPDRDRDGVPDAQDLCPNEPPGATPDPRAAGCPVRDADHDGVPDSEDLCPGAAAGAHPDAAHKGCPQIDADEDGVPDAEDQCPGQPSGATPDPARPGCPLVDADHDGVPDAEDLCPGVAAGANPDPKRPGCPMPDADGDGIADDLDACPGDAGVPDADPKSNGCPKLAIDRGVILQLRSVHFHTNEWEILPESFPILDEAARVLQSRPDLDEVVIEGHADDRGTHAWNLRLSRHRAQAVVDYLVQKGVKRGRLSSVGYGDTRPLSTEKSDAARTANRRVEVRVPKK